MIINKIKIKTGIALIFSFLISNFLIKEVFLANTPKIRPNLDQYFLAKINKTKEKISNTTDKLLAKLKLNIFDFKLNQKQIASEKKTQIETKTNIDKNIAFKREITPSLNKKENESKTEKNNSKANKENDSLITNNVIQNQTNDTILNSLKKNLRPVAKGIKVANMPGYSYTEIDVKEVEWIKTIYKLKNGKNIIIKYPKGQKPPTKSIFE